MWPALGREFILHGTLCQVKTKVVFVVIWVLPLESTTLLCCHWSYVTMKHVLCGFIYSYVVISWVSNATISH